MRLPALDANLNHHRRESQIAMTNIHVDLAGKVALITGGGSGIGRGFALAMARAGAGVAVLDIDGDAAARVSDEVVALGQPAVAHRVDVTDAAAIQAAVDATIAALGHIDFVFANAGVLGPADFLEISPLDWDGVLDVNVKGVAHTCRAVAPHMMERRAGRILVTASYNGVHAGAHVIPYRVSKAAAIMYTRCLAMVMAPYDVTVNAICPGVTLTPMQLAYAEADGRRTRHRHGGIPGRTRRAHPHAALHRDRRPGRAGALSRLRQRAAHHRAGDCARRRRDDFLMTAAPHLPQTMLAWPFFGDGLASLGVNGAPVRVPVPRCGAGEILARVDALGLCASDVKMVRQGGRYPLFFDRDFAANPAQLGHEVALTVVAVGEQWQGRYTPGQRLGLQPDVFAGGKRAIFGVNLPGGMAQYVTLGPAVLGGDHGSYVFPVPPALSHADVALLEPWACIDVAFSRAARRLARKPGGTLWIAGRRGDTTPYHFDAPLESAHVVAGNVPPELLAWLAAQPVELTVTDDLPDFALPAPWADARFDDIILLDPQRAAPVAAAAGRLLPRGTLNLVTPRALDGPVAVDASRLHYEQWSLLGCPGPAIDAAYGPARNRSEVRPGGVLLVVGAGGAMGRMHIQRALEMPAGPRAIVATNRGQARLRQPGGALCAAGRRSGPRTGHRESRGRAGTPRRRDRPADTRARLRRCRRRRAGCRGDAGSGAVAGARRHAGALCGNSTGAGHSPAAGSHRARRRAVHRQQRFDGGRPARRARQGRGGDAGAGRLRGRHRRDARGARSAGRDDGESLPRKDRDLSAPARSAAAGAGRVARRAARSARRAGSGAHLDACGGSGIAGRQGGIP